MVFEWSLLFVAYSYGGGVHSFYSYVVGMGIRGNH